VADQNGLMTSLVRNQTLTFIAAWRQRRRYTQLRTTIDDALGEAAAWSPKRHPSPSLLPSPFLPCRPLKALKAGTILGQGLGS
jgi:hypothetical protein